MNQNWRDRAMCKGMDTKLFFPRRGEHRIKDRLDPVVVACRNCPVRQNCLDYIMEIEKDTTIPRVGYWGGMSANARRDLARQRRAS